MYYLIATFPELCEQKRVPRYYVDLTEDRMKKKGINVEDVFKTKTLFGEDRKKILGDVFNPGSKGGTRHFTEDERRFMMLCARTPAKQKTPFPRGRMKVSSTFDFI
jgi:hypothetical protein